MLIFSRALEQNINDISLTFTSFMYFCTFSTQLYFKVQVERIGTCVNRLVLNLVFATINLFHIVNQCTILKRIKIIIDHVSAEEYK